MQEEQAQDQALVTFTDLLLAGQLPEAAERPPMAETIEVLARVLSPQQPPEHLRLRIRRQVLADWGKTTPTLGQRLRELASRPRYRWAWATVAALLIVALAAVVLLPGGGGEMIGTAWGEGTILPLFLLFLTLLGALLVAWWLSHRR